MIIFNYMLENDTSDIGVTQQYERIKTNEQ